MILLRRPWLLVEYRSEWIKDWWSKLDVPWGPDNQKTKLFDFFANPGRGRLQYPVPASTGLLRPVSTWICKKIKKALSSGYLMGHLILTTSPWSILTWITLVAIRGGFFKWSLAHFFKFWKDDAGYLMSFLCLVE